MRTRALHTLGARGRGRGTPAEGRGWSRTGRPREAGQHELDVEDVVPVLLTAEVVVEVIKVLTALGFKARVATAIAVVWHAVHVKGQVAMCANVVWVEHVAMCANVRDLADLLVQLLQAHFGQAIFDAVFGSVERSSFFSNLCYVLPGNAHAAERQVSMRWWGRRSQIADRDAELFMFAQLLGSLSRTSRKQRACRHMLEVCSHKEMFTKNLM